MTSPSAGLLGERTFSPRLGLMDLSGCLTSGERQGNLPREEGKVCGHVRPAAPCLWARHIYIYIYGTVHAKIALRIYI